MYVEFVCNYLCVCRIYNHYTEQVPRLVVSPSDGAIGVEYAKGGTLYSNATPTGPVAKEVASVAVTANAVAAKL